MAIAQYPEGSAMRKEMDKWEGRPFVFRMYPKLLYKAREHNGKFVCGIPFDDSFALQCQRTVESELEEKQAKEEGWWDSPRDAIDHQIRILRDISNAAAERHYADSKMSAKAQAEAKAADDATEHQLPEVPISRIKR